MEYLENGSTDVHQAFLRKQYHLLHAENIDWQDANGDTCLHLATTAQEVMILVYTFGANTEIKNILGHTPLIQAACDGHKEVVEAFIEGTTCDLWAIDECGLRASRCAMIMGHSDIAWMLQEAEEKMGTRF